jgi:hypothetical protein
MSPRLEGSVNSDGPGPFHLPRPTQPPQTATTHTPPHLRLRDSSGSSSLCLFACLPLLHAPHPPWTRAPAAALPPVRLLQALHEWRLRGLPWLRPASSAARPWWSSASPPIWPAVVGCVCAGGVVLSVVAGVVVQARGQVRQQQEEGTEEKACAVGGARASIHPSLPPSANRAVRAPICPSSSHSRGPSHHPYPRPTHSKSARPNLTHHSINPSLNPVSPSKPNLSSNNQSIAQSHHPVKPNLSLNNQSIAQFHPLPVILSKPNLSFNNQSVTQSHHPVSPSKPNLSLNNQSVTQSHHPVSQPSFIQ